MKTVAPENAKSLIATGLGEWYVNIGAAQTSIRSVVDDETMVCSACSAPRCNGAGRVCQLSERASACLSAWLPRRHAVHVRAATIGVASGSVFWGAVLSLFLMRTHVGVRSSAMIAGVWSGHQRLSNPPQRSADAALLPIPYAARKKNPNVNVTPQTRGWANGSSRGESATAATVSGRVTTSHVFNRTKRPR